MIRSAILMMGAAALAGCSRSDPELDAARKRLQETFQHDCVEQAIPPSMMEACAFAHRTLMKYGP